jgi:hypothetical protein
MQLERSRSRMMLWSDNYEISLSASSMLFMGPSQVSWILRVTQVDTDADTRKCVGLISLEFWIPVLSSTFCVHQFVVP